MNPILGTALSGMMANTQKLATSANNVANALTPNFTPKEATLESVNAGGVRVQELDVQPASIPSYQPDSPEADAEGMVSLPNVSMEQEMVEQKLAVIGYSANAAVVKAVSKMNASLFDIKT